MKFQLSRFIFALSSLCLLSASVYARHHRVVIDSAAVLKDFLQDPSDKNLYRLRNSCSQKPVNTDRHENLISDLKKLPKTLTSIRADVLMMHCGLDGALSEDWVSFLGNDVLLEKPDVLLTALAREPESESLLSSIAYSSGPSGDSPFTDCDQNCLPKIDNFYAKKRDVVQSAKLKTPIEKDFQQKMLSEIEKVQKDWHQKLTSSAGKSSSTSLSSPKPN